MKILSVLALFMVIVGCRTMPLYNIENVEIDPAKDIKKVESLIKEAARDRGWKVKTVKPGVIRAKLFARKHELVLKIPFSESRYSIIYVDSKNLKYDGENIHKKYGSWVESLKTDIDRIMYD